MRAGCCTRGWLRVRGKFQTEKLGGSRPTPAGRGEGRELSFPGLPGWKHPRLAAAPGVQVRPESLRRCVWGYFVKQCIGGGKKGERERRSFTVSVWGPAGRLRELGRVFPFLVAYEAELTLFQLVD